MPGDYAYSGVSLFAGCGGSDLGLIDAGIEPVWANEVSPVACELYEDVTGLDVIENADIRRIDRFPDAEILAGCYPCTGYSQGGRRNREDRINRLYQEFDRALRQIRPLAFIVENVDGMRYSQNEELFRAQIVRFRSAGYRVKDKLLDAKNYGLPQDRKRLFLVGIRSDLGLKFEFPEPTHGPDEGLKKRKTLRDTIWRFRKAAAGTYCDEPFHWYYLSRNRRRSWDEQAKCVVAHWRHVGLHPDSPPLVKLGPDRWVFEDSGPARRLSYVECAAIQGFPKPDAFKSGSIRQKFRAIGNAVPPPLFSAVARGLVEHLNRR